MRDLLIGAEARIACPCKLARLYDYSTGPRAVFMNARCLVRTTPPPRCRGRPLKPPAVLGALCTMLAAGSRARGMGFVRPGRARRANPVEESRVAEQSRLLRHRGPLRGRRRARRDRRPASQGSCPDRRQSASTELPLSPEVGCLLVGVSSAPQDSPPARGSYQSLRYRLLSKGPFDTSVQ